MTTYKLLHAKDVDRVRQDDPFFAGTLAKGLLILQCFVAEPRPHANSELAAKLGIPRPTVSRLCRSLHLMGYLDHDERLDRYFIGPAAVALGYPYVIQTPLLGQLRMPMQALADKIEGAVSVGVASDLDVVYVETCAFLDGTLRRPGVGATRGVMETAMGRSHLAQLSKAAQQSLLARVRTQRPEEYAHCLAGVRENLAHARQRGFAINLGDAGMGVLAVGVASKIMYGSRNLLFNCAVPGIKNSEKDLLTKIGPALRQLVEAANRLRGNRY